MYNFNEKSIQACQLVVSNHWTGLLDLMCLYHLTSIQANVINLVAVTALLYKLYFMHFSTAC